jgi:hypothetical protein
MRQRPDRTKPSMRTKLTPLLSGRSRPIGRDFPSAGQPAADKTAKFCPLKRVARHQTKPAQSSKLATCNSRLAPRNSRPASCPPLYVAKNNDSRQNPATQSSLPTGLAQEFCGSGLRPRCRLAATQHLAMGREIGVGDASHRKLFGQCPSQSLRPFLRQATLREASIGAFARYSSVATLPVAAALFAAPPPCLPGASSDVDRYAHPDAR